MISALAPLPEAKKMSVFRKAPMALSCPITRPISRSIRSTIAAWIAIFVAWKRCCSSVNSFHGSGRLISPGPSF